MSMIEELAKLMAPIKRQIDGMVCRVVLRNVNDAAGRQEVQVEGMDGDLHPVVEHFQPFGVRGYPPTGVDGLGFAVGGYRNHLAVMALSAKTPSPYPLNPGDVYHIGTNAGVFTLLQASLGAWWGQGVNQWYATLQGLTEFQYIEMTPQQTLLHVQDPSSGKFSRLTITPTMVKIETESFVHP